VSAGPDSRRQFSPALLKIWWCRQRVWGIRKTATAYSVIAVLTIPIGTVVAIPVGAKTLTVSVTEVVLGLFVCHLVVLAGWPRIKSFASAMPRAVSVLAVGIALLALPVAWAPDTAAAGAAYINFALGGVGGLLVGATWGRMARRSLNPIDVALIGFVGISALELAIEFVRAGGGANLHHHVNTTWGQSNYVAGVMVVASVALLGRALVSTNGRLVMVLSAAVGIIASLLLYSRGGVMALGAGLLVLAWSVRGPRRTRVLLRCFSFIIPLTAWAVIYYTTSIRLLVNRQVLINVDARYAIWRIAWLEFLHHPLRGTGWTALRQASLVAFAQPTTFAHNLILSFLQIGGLLAVPYLVGLIWLLARSTRVQMEMSGALVAGIAIALTDPFFEGTVGGMIVLAIAIRGMSWRRGPEERLRTIRGHGVGPPR